MRKNLDFSREWGRITEAHQSAPGQALAMRRHLQDFLARLTQGVLEVKLPALAEEWTTRGPGHFHLVPELFLQIRGWTRFRFPHDELELGPGELLVVPPRLLHDEDVRGGEDGEDFRNVVVHASGPALSCHIAREETRGRPGIEHLEVRHHPQAARVLSWLDDAAGLIRPPDGQAAPGAAHATVQVRALVTAALAGVLQALDETPQHAPPEAPLVARARLLIQNQLGDHELSVKRLATQLGCTADYLSHVFARTAGEHLAVYINRQRMERGARLLRDSRLAGKEIAWACGFATHSYFIRNFRAHFGTTPKAWRLDRPPAGDAPREAAP